MGLLSRFKRAVGIKNKYAVREIQTLGKLRAAALLSDGEKETLSKAERQERFRRWRKEQGL
jgi:hypothetical protein